MTKTVEEVDTEVDHLRNRLDTLEEKAATPAKPWYKTTSTAISVFAFVVSLGSTVLSYVHTRQQDVHGLRTELRGILQRLALLPKENVESALKYRGDPTNGNVVSGALNQENMMLALQANEILRRLPANEVSAVDHMTVGQSLTFSRHFEAARVDLEKAAEASVGLDDEIGTLRNLANLEMVTGRRDKSRVTFRRAMDIFTKYKDFDSFTRGSANTQTALIWAGAEAGIQNFEGAMQHLSEAETEVSKMPAGPGTDTWRLQVAQFKQTIYAARQGSPTANTMLPAALSAAGVATPTGTLGPSPQ